MTSPVNPRAAYLLRAAKEFLTEERIPSFYGADGFIPDEAYDADDADRCLKVLRALGL